MKLHDLTGLRFGSLTVLRRTGTNAAKQPVWECRCDCGTVISRASAELKKGGDKASCGCRKGISRRKDLTGQRFGRLTVIEGLEHPRWKCICDCGAVHIASGGDLSAGHTKSCGCLKRDVLSGPKPERRGKTAHNRKDWTGVKLHKLTFVEPHPIRDGKRIKWVARCDCGNTISIVPKAAASGNTKSCGCARADAAKLRGDKLRGIVREDYRKSSMSAIGKRFGKLLVTRVEWVDCDTYRIAFADCICDCGNTYRARLPDLRNGKTVTCGCGNMISDEEANIADWLSGLADIQQQYRIGKWTYDIAVPSARVLVEYNGAWWHSSKFVNRGLHQVKRRNAEDEGWRVINVWSDDWSRGENRIKALILDAIGQSQRRIIGARRLRLESVPADTAINFHAAHHVQTAPPTGGSHVGAFFDEDLIGVGTFKQCSKHVELTRYTVKSGISAPGLLSRMIKHTAPQQAVVTFADRDYFTGKLYLGSGFEKVSTTLQLTYLDGNNTRKRRETYMKHKLPALGVNTKGMSERESLEAVGIFQCWNSGIDKWVRPPSPS